MVTDTDDSELDDKNTAMPPLIYLEDSGNEEDNPHESPSDPPSADPNPEFGPSSKKPTSETDYSALLEPYAPMRESSMGHLSPIEIMRYQKGSCPAKFATLEEHTKEAPRVYRWELPVNKHFLTVVLAIYHYVGRMGEFSLPPNLFV